MTFSAADLPNALSHVADRLDALGDDRCARAAAALRRYMEDSNLTLDEAFGAKTAPGARPWRKIENLRRRDNALCRLAEIVAPNVDISARAEAIRQRIIRYAAFGWRYDRLLDEMPAAYVGRPEAELFAAFRAAGDDVPDGFSTLRRILSKGRGAEMLRAPKLPPFDKQEREPPSSANRGNSRLGACDAKS